MKRSALNLTGVFFLLFTVHTSATVRYVDLNNANPASPYTDWSIAATNIQDAVDSANSGDTVIVTNGVYHTGSRLTSDGTQNRVVVTNGVILQSVNGPTVTSIDGGNLMRCVYLTNGAVLDGFTLTNGKAGSGGGVFNASTNELVSNCQIVNNSSSGPGGGVYGGTVIDCTISGNSTGGALGIYGGGASSATLSNCNISGNTAVYGGGGVSHCTVYNSFLTNNLVTSASSSGAGAYESTLNNCTLSGNHYSILVWGGAAAYSTLNDCKISTNSALEGGGIYFSTANNCSISGNIATYGGGAYNSTLNNCTLTGNGAGEGGGAYRGSLINCTITRNSATHGGGEFSCAVENSIIFYNTGDLDYDNYYIYDTLSYCCTTPLPAGNGNIASDPIFVNAPAGDFHLQLNSPCINSGNNLFAPTGTDLEGNARIVAGTVDIGAYEFQSPSSVLSYAWAQQYGLPTDGSADYADSDGDGMNNWQEWRAGTNPTNGLSVLQLSAPAYTNSPNGIIVSWQSVSIINYYLQRSSDLSAQPAFSTIQSNIVGQVGTTSFMDTTVTNGGSYFYRIGVQ